MNNIRVNLEIEILIVRIRSAMRENPVKHY